MNAGGTRLAVDSATGLQIELAVAGPGARSFAFILDWHIRLLLAIAWWLASSLAVTGSMGGIPDESNAGEFFGLVVVLPAVAIYLLYHPLLEVFMHGRTPGKRIAGVRIATRNGLTPGVGALLIRNVFRLIDGLPGFYGVGLASTVITADHVRLGDLAAGTLLLYERSDGRSGRQDFVTELATTQLDPQLAELIDDLLARWKKLQPPVRVQLAQKLLLRVDPAATSSEDSRQLQEQLRNYLSPGS